MANIVAQVGVWGTKSQGTPANQWSFRLEKDYKLTKISIDHGDVIYSLQFTTEDPSGGSHESKKAGGWSGGSQVTEVTFDSDEEIISINGTVGTKGIYTVISSLSFTTNKKTHGPFGKETENSFEVPWNKGAFAGFYGHAGSYIDSIGVYLYPTAP